MGQRLEILLCKKVRDYKSFDLSEIQVQSTLNDCVCEYNDVWRITGTYYLGALSALKPIISRYNNVVDLLRFVESITLKAVELPIMMLCTEQNRALLFPKSLFIGTLKRVGKAYTLEFEINPLETDNKKFKQVLYLNTNKL